MSTLRSAEVLVPDRNPAPALRIGADVGGIFTDLVLLDEAGNVWKRKVPSTRRISHGGVLEAVERQWRLLGSDTAHLAIRSDRRDHRPDGLQGGQPGIGSINVLRHHDGTEEILPTMISREMSPGDELYHHQSGGGGWENPRDRDPVAVVEDVRNGRISPEAAQTDSGGSLNNTG